MLHSWCGTGEYGIVHAMFEISFANKFLPNTHQNIIKRNGGLGRS